jgi:DNA invertase Pin-like site-specific DNA recombinase
MDHPPRVARAPLGEGRLAGGLVASRSLSLPALQPLPSEPLEALPDLDLHPLVARLVEDATNQLVGQVLLLDIGILEVVRVAVPLAVAMLLRQPPMGRWPQVQRDRQAALLLDLGQRREVRPSGPVRLRRRCHVRSRLCEWYNYGTRRQTERSPMNRYPAAYVRKSHKDQASAEAQLAAILPIAHADGANGNLEVYRDVGISGRFGKRGEGSDWARLNADVEAGRVETVYVSVLDRAGRSLEEWLGFTRRCVKHDTRVVDKSGERTRDGFDLAVIEMLFSDKEGRKAEERSARAAVTMASRAYTLGKPPYGWRVAWLVDGETVDVKPEKRADIRRVFVPNPEEPLQPLLDTVRETRGNVLRAARLLNERGIPSRSGRPWSARTLSRVLDREGVVRAKYGARVRRAPSTAPLARLVACHCGQLMTPVRDRRTGRWSELYCAVGHKAGVAEHGRYTARARHVIDRLRSEKPLRRSYIHIIKRDKVEDAAEQRAKLEAKRRHLGMALADDAIEEDEYRRQMDEVKRAIADLEDQIDSDWIGFGPLTPIIPWDGDGEALGTALRQRVRVVRLDAQMMPSEVEWRVQPETNTTPKWLRIKTARDARRSAK